MRSAVSRPRSARISTSLISAMVAASSLRLATRSEMAPPSADDVRLSPPVRRCHQLPFVCIVASFIRYAVAASGARDSGFAKVRNHDPGRDGVAASLSRRADAGARQARRDSPCIAAPRAEKGGESLEDHFDALRFGLPRSPALAHRLDRDTSGCLVLGRHRKALAQLGKLFKSGAIDKTYWAVVEGVAAD